MNPDTDAIKAYQRYNDAINAVLFDGQFAGRPLYLDIEGPLCESIARRLALSPDNFINGLAAAARASLSWDSQDVFGWHTEMARRWEVRGRAGYPPFTALLCSLSVAAERMRRDKQFESHNYYQRFFDYLKIYDEREQHKVRWSFKATRPFWDELNRWLLDKEGELGRPTAQQISGFPYVSYAVSQALIRDAERQNLHAMFVHFCFAPGERRTAAEMQVYVKQWIKGYHGTSTLNRLWKSEDLQEKLASAACDELESWDGAEAREEGGRQTYTPLWVCYIDPFPPPAAIYLNLTLPASIAAETGTLNPTACKDRNGRPLLTDTNTEFSFEPLQDEGLASLEPASKIKAGTLLQDGFELVNATSTVRLRKSALALLPFVLTGTGGLYKEVSRVSLLEPHVILCRTEWQNKVFKYLQSAARPGFKQHTPQSLKFLPVNWVAFEGVEIVRHADASQDLLPLVPVTETSIVLQRGVKLAEDVWHEDAAPEVLAASDEGPLRLELSKGPAPGNTVLAEASADETCVRLDLRGIALQPGTLNIVTVYQNEKALKQRNVILSSANTPRSIGVLTVPQLRYKIAPAHPLALMSAEPEEADSNSGVCLSGLSLTGTSQAKDESSTVPPFSCEIPVYEIDEEKRPPAFGADPSGSGRESCVVRGYHIWHVEAQESHHRPWDAKWCECKTCRKRYLARNRGKHRKEEAGLLRKPWPEAPHIAGLEAIRPSIDTIYDALCYLGGGKFRRFSEISSQASDKPFFVSRLMANLSALGHIDVQNDSVSGPPSAWLCAPPTAVMLSTGKTVLSGFRSKMLIESITATVRDTGGQLQQISQDGAPGALFISGLDAERLNELLTGFSDPHGRGVPLVSNPAAAIARYAPPLSSILSLLPETYVRAGETVEKFDPDSGWRCSNNTFEPGAYRTAGFSRICAFRTTSGELKRANYRIVKTLAAKMSGRRIHGYDAQRKEFVSALGCEPPPLFERALVACSGLLPKAANGRLIYTEVEPAVAGPILDKLYG